MVFRTETFLHIDGWDESYQFANEDVDLCRRLNEAGYEMIYTPQTSVDHWGTTGIDVVSHLWRWHSPDGGAATYPEFFSRVVEHCGKATKYAFEDALDGHFSGLPFDLAIVPIHIWRDWKQLH